MPPLTLDRKELCILEQATRRSGRRVDQEFRRQAELSGRHNDRASSGGSVGSRNRRSCGILLLGTNDLTQTTMGLSRDDAGRFLPDYVDEKKAGVFSAELGN